MRRPKVRADQAGLMGQLYGRDAELDRLRAENERLRERLRWHIRVYRVGDDQWNPEQFADELLAKELTTNTIAAR